MGGGGAGTCGAGLCERVWFGWVGGAYVRRGFAEKVSVECEVCAANSSSLELPVLGSPFLSSLCLLQGEPGQTGDPGSPQEPLEALLVTVWSETHIGSGNPHPWVSLASHCPRDVSHPMDRPWNVLCIFFGMGELLSVWAQQWGVAKASLCPCWEPNMGPCTPQTCASAPELPPEPLSIL